MKTVGIVLAGGLSSRFGSPKAFGEIDGRFFYEYIVKALKRHCDEVVIVTRPELVARFPEDLRVVTDVAQYAGLGPLAGIYTGMDVCAASRYIVLPCDMPFMTADVIEQLTIHDTGEVTAVRTAANDYPLVSIWGSHLKQQIQQSLEENKLGVMRFLQTVKTTWINGETISGDYENIFKNINRVVDIERGGSDACNR